MTKSWEPFEVRADRRAPAPREINTVEGVGDRLRAAAFAEIQAREAFQWAASRFTDAPLALKQAWLGLAKEEDKHLNWLFDRMQQLGIEIKERPVNDFLWRSFMDCNSAEQFAKFMASAEERGRIAGERFYRSLVQIDPISAEIFRKIAEEEVAHIRLAETFFPETKLTQKNTHARSSLPNRI